jgi:hypothetical protein
LSRDFGKKKPALAGFAFWQRISAPPEARRALARFERVAPVAVLAGSNVQKNVNDRQARAVTGPKGKATPERVTAQ